MSDQVIEHTMYMKRSCEWKHTTIYNHIIFFFLIFPSQYFERYVIASLEQRSHMSGVSKGQIESLQSEGQIE